MTISESQNPIKSWICFRVIPDFWFKEKESQIILSFLPHCEKIDTFQVESSEASIKITRGSVIDIWSLY